MFYRIGAPKLFKDYIKTPVSESLFNEDTSLYPTILLKENTPLQGTV